MKENMSFYKINREERHFGFLLQAAILSSKSFREKVFSKITRKTNLDLTLTTSIYMQKSLSSVIIGFSFGDQATYRHRLAKKEWVPQRLFYGDETESRPY
jgi:hypothetical protein